MLDWQAEKIAHATVVQAVDDYWKATSRLKALEGFSNDLKQKQKAKNMLDDCVSFFNSPWFETLAGFPYEMIKDRVDKNNPYVSEFKTLKNGKEVLRTDRK